MTYSNYGPLQPHRDELSAKPGEDFDAWFVRVRTDAVIDPDLLASEQDRMATESRRRGEMTFRAHRRVVRATLCVTGSVLAIAASVVLHFVTGLTWWLAAASAIATIASMAAKARATALELAAARPAPGPALGRDDVVRLAEFDDSSRDLLTRARRAIGEVLSSKVYRQDLLDQSAGEAALRRLEWEAALSLREITGLRAEMAANPATGPQTAEIRESQRLYLESAHDRATSRVRAIEQYAEQVRQADAALVDYQGALRASGLNDRFRELVARTAADEHAIGELAEMTARAAAAERVYRSRIGQAHQAGAVLATPPEPRGLRHD